MNLKMPFSGFYGKSFESEEDRDKAGFRQMRRGYFTAMAKGTGGLRYELNSERSD
jgi:hypothetical protein